MATVSLVMIVKNEEKVLETCLKSVKNFVDEIIIVDTGSTDETVEIARKYTDKVFHFTWDKSFSSARNYAKEKATSDWILQLDADEYMSEENAKKMHEVIENTKYDGLLLNITNLVEYNQMGISHPYVRLFRNRPWIAYKGRVHEQVLCNGEPFDLEMTDIKIVHSGYVTEKIEEKQKNERNFELLFMEHKENPKDGFINLNLSNQYLSIQNYEKCIEHAEIAFRNGEDMNFRHKAISNVIYSLNALERYEKSLEVIQDAQTVYRDFTDLWYLEGRVLENMKRDKEAEKSYLHCLTKGESPKTYQSLVGSGTYLPLEQLMTLALKYRDFKKVYTYLTMWLQIKKFDESNIAFAYRFLEVYVKSEDVVMDFFDKIYPNESLINVNFKFKMYYLVHSIKGMKRIVEVMKNKKVNFRNNILISLLLEDFEQAKKFLLEKNDPKLASIGIVLWALTKDPTVKKIVEEMRPGVKHIIDELEDSVESRETKAVDLELYSEVIFLLTDMKQYDLVERMVKYTEYYPPTINNVLYELFSSRLDDELALVFLSRYVNEGARTVETIEKMALILYTLGEYEKSLNFIEILEPTKEKNFKYWELKIENLEKLEKVEELQDTCIEAVQLFPESSYIIEKMEALV